MTDPKFQNVLQNIQSQLSTLGNLASTPQPSLAPYPQQDLFSLVKTAVQAEISKLGLNNRQNPMMNQIATPQEIPTGVSMLLPSIGSAFTKEQQEWLSQPQNIIGLPGYFMSNDGKAALNIILDSYQQFVQGKK
jgi:hypothetical protein